MSYVSQSAVGSALGLRRSSIVLSYHNVSIIAAILDCILVTTASVTAGIGYRIILGDEVENVGVFVGVGLYAALLLVLLIKSQGLYRPIALLSKGRQIRGVVYCWLAVLLVTTLVLFLLKIGGNVSRGATIGFSVLGIVFLVSSRIVLSNKLSKAVACGSLSGQRAIIIGEAQELVNCSAADLLRRCGIREVGRFELPPANGDDRCVPTGDAAVLAAAITSAQTHEAEMVLLALRWTDTARRAHACERLRALPLPALLLPDQSVASILSQAMVELGSEIAVELQRSPLSRIELLLKRAMDLIISGVALVLLSPLLSIVSLAIMLDCSGPAIFRQKRKGFNGREFTIYKFRTMNVMENGATIRQAQHNDRRVTTVGRFLRMTSIDELPQLINVIRGEMSLVGPRPHALVHDDEYVKLIANYAFRHHVKPGLTGWAQIKGFRGETPQLELMERRVDLDLWYIDNWSIWLDFWILLRTCWEVPRGRNAH